MQICLADDSNMDLEIFDIVFHKVLEDDIVSALECNTKITAHLLNLLDVNNIS